MQRDLREFGATTLLGKLWSAKRTAALAAVMRQPEFPQAVEAARRHARRHPDPLGWLLGRLADDGALVEAGRDAFSDRELMAMESDAVVNPDSTDAPYAELFRAARASR
jgi:hypothetical protein